MEAIPTYEELVYHFGPYFGLVLFLVLFIISLQAIWFSILIKSKNKEIKRSFEREEKLNEQLIAIMDKYLNFYNNKKLK